MKNENDKYAVVHFDGVVHITYNDLVKAKTYVKNFRKERGITLLVKEQKQP